MDKTCSAHSHNRSRISWFRTNRLGLLRLWWNAELFMIGCYIVEYKFNICKVERSVICYCNI